MKKHGLYILLCLYSFYLFPQGKKYARPQPYNYYIDILKNAKDSLYQSVMLKYDNYLKENPTDVNVCIEKCRLMENAYYDEYEDYNPKYEECEVYLDSLMKVFPGEPELLIFKTEYLYGDSAIAFCNRVVKHHQQYPEKWKDKDIWKIYEKLSVSYSIDKKPEKSIKYALLATNTNDTLDLSLNMAEQYMDLKEDDKAIDVLLHHLDSTSSSWTLNQKGKLLLELGAFKKALAVLKWCSKDTSSNWSDNSVFAKAMIENGFYSEARAYIIKDMQHKWRESKTLIRLFDYDLKYSPADSAANSYYRLAANDFMNDPVGIKRLRLFFKAPALIFTINDLLRIALLIISFALIFAVPYVILLPVHFVGNYYRSKGRVFSQDAFRWSLRHFWITGALIMIIDVLANLLFDHDNFFGNGDNEVEKAVNPNLANLTLFTLICYTSITCLILKKEDIKLFFGNIWTKQRSILTGIGYSLLLRFAMGIYLVIYKYLPIESNDAFSDLSVVDNIVSVNNFYHPLLGFLFVVIIVPIYEEVLFRGVFLSASEKYMRFFWANTLQALLFAAVHMNLKLFPFYLAFGYIAGYQKRKSQALATGISMHMANNLIAFLAILALRG